MNKGFQKIARRAFSAYPAYVTSAPAIESGSVANGIKMVAEDLGGEVTNIDVMIDVGSRVEAPNVSGIASFAGNLSLNPYSSEIDAIGGKVSVTVGREQSIFSASVLSKDVPKAMNIISKAINSTPDSDYVNKYRTLRETYVDETISDYRGTILDQLHETAYLSTPLGTNPLGTPETISGLSKGDIDDFKAKYYTSDRMVVSASGAVDSGALQTVIEKELGGVKAPTGSIDSAIAPSIFTGSDKRIRYDSHGTALVAIGFETKGTQSEDAMTYKLMTKILGEWDVSGPIGNNSSFKLARELAEHKMVHGFKPFNFGYKDTGLFGVCFEATDNNLEDTTWYLLDNLVRLCHDVTAVEVEYAKAALKTEVLTHKSNGALNSAVNGNQMLANGRVMTTAEIMVRIDALTVDDVKSAADKVINDEDHALAAVGPIFELPDYNWIRRRSYWHRF